MSLLLDVAERRQLTAATGAMLSPMSGAAVEEWPLRVNRAVATLVGADKASLVLAASDGSNGTSAFSEQLGQAALDYPRQLGDCNARYQLWRRQLELGAWNRRAVYGRHYRRIRRTPYHNEYVVPLRAFDAIGLTLRAGPRRELATLFFHHERPTGRRFGSHGVELLEVLLPSFRAGVEAWLRLQGVSAELGRLLDALDEPILLTDDSGREVHRNRALATLLAEDPAAAIIPAARRLAANLARLGRDGWRAAPPVARVRGRRGHYSLSATLAPTALAPGPMALVIVRREAAPAPPDMGSTLRSRFGLTEQEARVAILLGQRRTNAEIAARLVISPHTARHHTESVLRKLGLSSRTQVSGRLQAL